MDEIDVSMLKVLQEDGRITISDLSKKLALSRPSVTERMNRLIEKGVIDKFSAIVSPESVGRKLLVMIELNDLKRQPSEIEETMSKDPRIIACYRATGHVHYYVKAALNGMDDLQQLVEILIPYCNTRTSILLHNSINNQVILPLDK